MEAEENGTAKLYDESNDDESISTLSYHSEDFISKPTLSENGTVPIDFLEFDHSFGYDCRRLFNLCVADPDTLIFASGNLIHFFNVAKNVITFRRSSTGGGIGHITKNPVFDHIAIGECGINPPIIIYEWPSMEIVTVLNEGTTRCYSHLRYSPDGEQLVSQGGDPDYLITVWDWKKSSIALQCKSHGQDVYSVVFSSTMPGRMTSCGAGHVKSWRMSSTFTGLKLQGELGRFGKTEISDIVAVYSMPDEKVISGCEWGNILVWDEGLIKVEVRRKKGRPCHASYVTQFEYANGELVSVGTDGNVNVWYYETIDRAEPPEDNRFVEVEPIYEFVVGSGSRRAMLMQILKRNPDDPDSSLWYAQDGNGGIHLIDLSTLQTPKPSQRLLTCHAGPIMDMDLCDWGTYAATIGQDGFLNFYDYEDKKLVERSGSTLVCAFGSGVLRMVRVNLNADDDDDDKRGKKVREKVRLMQVLKPHCLPITCMSANRDYSLLVTASEDSTIFAFGIQDRESCPTLVPIGYVRVPSCVTFMTWKPDHSSTLFMGCSRGDCVQVDLPEEPQSYTKISYSLTECKPVIFKFESVKSSIRREQNKLENERRRQMIIAEGMEELRLMKEKNPNVEIDEEFFIESALGEEETLPDIYVPEVPNKVTSAFYTKRNSVMLWIGGYDAGYTYEYSNPEPDKGSKHLGSRMIADADDEEVQSHLFWNDGKYLILGMEHGEIRVCRLKPEDESDFSDYWILPMHDNANGRVTSMRLSHDDKMLLTCGYDGNLFSFVVNGEESTLRRTGVTRAREEDNRIPSEDVIDIDELDYPSLEQVIVRAEEDRVMAHARQEKEKTLETLHQLTEEFDSILKRNESLPASQRLTEEELELDPRITADLNDQLKAEMDVVNEKLAYDEEKCRVRLKKLMDHFIEPITCLPFAVTRILKPDTMVHSLRELKLTGDYVIDRPPLESDLRDQCAEESAKRMDEQASESVNESAKGERDLDPQDDKDENQDEDEGATKIHGVESFLKGLSPRTVEFQLGDEINQMLKKYRALKSKLEEQEQEWKVLQSQRPDPRAIHPEDEAAIDRAKNTIGDYKLKASLHLDESVQRRQTVSKKYKQIIDCRRKIHFRREDFNEKLREMRSRKAELISEIDGFIKRLRSIHTEIPEEWIAPLPNLPDFDEDLEFPEKKLQLEAYTPMEERVRETKRKKQSVMLLLSDLPVEDFDEEYQVLLLDESRFRAVAPDDSIGRERRVKIHGEVKTVRVELPLDVLRRLQEDEKVDSKIEREMKRTRAERKKHEQEQILSHVQESYEAFDEELDVLEKERLDIVVESVYMDLFLLTLHQELIVLERFESVENRLSEKFDLASTRRNDLVGKVNELTAKIDERNRGVRKLQERIRDTTARYLRSVKEDKYYGFLKKICMKRYKHPRADNGASSSESSSSEDSSERRSHADEEDEEAAAVAGAGAAATVTTAASDASENVILLHLDENVCPEGCDRDLYNEAFAAREKRYEMEHRIREQQRAIESLQKELDMLRKSLASIESELLDDREKLNAYLSEKQRQLNDIDVTVVLKLSQLQCFTESGKSEKIQNCIVFDKNRLSQLYARVGELQQETRDQLTKHKNDRAHLRRMKLDCQAMRKELESLKERIKREMEQKFGQQVSLVTLYEAVLRRLIYDIKADTGSIVRYYDDRIKGVKSEYKQQLQILNDLIRENTEKLSFVTVLEEELLKLRRALDIEPMPEEEIDKLEKQYEADLKRLRALLKNQEKQKEWIYRDIRSLSSKSKNLPPPNQPEPKGGRRPTLTLLDGAEQQESTFDLDKSYSREETSIDAREYSIGESYYYKKVIAIRHLLSQVATVDESNTKETIERMLKEITDNLENAGYRREDIERNISDIIRLSEEGQEFAHISSKETIESLGDLVHRFGAELREMSAVQELTEEVREKLDDLFSSVAIKDESGHIAQTLVSKLRQTGSVTSALRYVLQKFPLDTDDETMAALRKYVKRVLREILQHVELRGRVTQKDEC